MRPRILLPVGLASLAFLVSGCASTTRLQIKRAPELSLPGVKTIKLKEFDVSGDLRLDLTSGGGLLSAVVNAGLDAGVNAAASRKDEGFQKQNLSDLKQAILKNGYYKVTDGDNYDALITGSYVYDVEDDGEEGSEKTKEGTRYWYQIKRKTTAKVNFTVADKTGNIIGASDATGSATANTQADTRSQARNNIEGWQTLVRRSFTQSNESLVRKIAPYYVTESRSFEKGDDTRIKDAGKQAAEGSWDAAVATWKSTLSGTPKDKVASLQNLAIYDESQGEVDSALVKYQEVQKLDPSSSHAADVSRTMSRVEEIKRLKEAEAARAPAPAPAPVAAPAPEPVAAPINTTAPAAAPAKPAKKTKKIN